MTVYCRRCGDEADLPQTCEVCGRVICWYCRSVDVENRCYDHAEALI
jgi:hypothetical protein